jgi:hypothetical protein
MIEIDGIKWFTLIEVAAMFVKKTKTISSWRRQGRLQGKKISKRIYIFSEIDIKKIVEGI